MPESHKNLETVNAIYQAFGEGNVPAILARLREDVRWEDFADNQAQAAGVPWMARLDGRENVVQFFSILGGWQFHEFRVLSVMAGGNKVAVEVEVDATIPDPDRRFREQEMHLWTFDDSGQVVSFRHYMDTARQIALARVVPAAPES